MDWEQNPFTAVDSSLVAGKPLPLKHRLIFRWREREREERTHAVVRASDHTQPRSLLSSPHSFRAMLGAQHHTGVTQWSFCYNYFAVYKQDPICFMIASCFPLYCRLALFNLSFHFFFKKVSLWVSSQFHQCYIAVIECRMGPNSSKGGVNLPIHLNKVLTLKPRFNKLKINVANCFIADHFRLNI